MAEADLPGSALSGSPAEPRKGAFTPARQRKSMHLRQPKSIGSTHLAFVRAILNGIAPVKAAALYLGETLDLRVARSVLKGLNHEIAQAALAHPNPKLCASILAGFDPKKTEQSKAQLCALVALEPILNAPPAADHPLSAWLEPAQCARLAGVGVDTVGELALFVTLNGYRWFDRVPAFGQGKAKKLVDWLLKYEQNIGVELKTAAITPAAPPGRALVSLAPGTHLVTPGVLAPMQHALIPQHLRGDDGAFRQFGPNTLGAGSDYEAIQAWLRKYERKPATQRAYSKEAERFYLWCLLVKKKSMSSLTGPDCADYRIFLERLPQDWIQQTKSPAPRSSAEWRPFRKRLASDSIKQALVVLQSMFESLRREGYLMANAMDYVMHGHTKGTARLHIERRFSDREWDHLMTMASKEEGAQGRRLRLVLELLISTGLRREELAKATYGSVEEVVLEDRSTAKVLSVIGKRNKRRDVPLTPKILEMLDAHRQDRIDRGLLNEQALLESDIPLIGALARPPATVHALAEELDLRPNGALSPDGLYRLLKRFFARCVEALPPGLPSQSFIKGSTHWLRHTTASRLLEGGAPMQVVRDLLGHASISTTSIYVNPEREQIIREVNKVDLGHYRQTNASPARAAGPAATREPATASAMPSVQARPEGGWAD